MIHLSARAIPARSRRLPLILLVALLVAACSGLAAPGVAQRHEATALPPGGGTPATTAQPYDDDVAGGGQAVATPRATTEPSRGVRPDATPTAAATATDTPRPATPRPTDPPTSSPAPTAAPTPLPAREAFALNLYRDGDYVSQYTFEWCVGASVQMMLNMVREPNESSRARQGEIWDLARVRSAGTNRFGGANPVGWTAALEELGAGDYELASIKGYEEALRAAARAVRDTNRPVGLVMWTGRHAWVMSGFTSLGDPAIHADFDVTGVRVLDPLYPHGSGRWGASPKPNALLTPEQLAQQFVTRTRNRPDYAVPGSYVLVLPS